MSDALEFERAGERARASEEPTMDNLIARVATAANLSPEVARKTVALIADFIQREASEDGVKDLFEKAPELQRDHRARARRPAAKAWVSV